MENELIIWALGALLTLFITALGFFWRHMDSRFDTLQKHRDQIEETISKHKQETDKKLNEFKLDVYNNFAKKSDNIQFRSEMKEDLDKIFSKLGALAQELNQLIGMMGKKRKS